MSLSQIKGERWAAYLRGHRWVLRYYALAGNRKTHRIPPHHKTSHQARKYIEIFIKEVHKRSSNPKEPSLLKGNRINSKISFKAFGKLWTSGKLHELFPRRVKKKTWSDSDESRLKLHVYPVLGEIEVRRFKGKNANQWCEEVLARLPPPEKFSEASTRHVAILVNRLMNLAAASYIDLIPTNPLHGYVPSIRKKKAKTYLFPSEDAVLMACELVPLKLRLLFGMLAREGYRVGELWGAQLYEFDLARNWCTIDKTKTGLAKDFHMSPGTARALESYCKHILKTSDPQSFLFLDSKEKFQVPEWNKALDNKNMAKTLRACLKLAKIKRREIFQKDANRIPLRVHDLRGSFVTVKLARGKSESWVATRTGHMSSVMINTYRRAAESYQESMEGDFTPLDEAIPELAKG